MKKNHEVRVKFSMEELERVKQKAEELGMPVSTYLRFLGLSSIVTTK